MRSIQRRRHLPNQVSAQPSVPDACLECAVGSVGRRSKATAICPQQRALDAREPRALDSGTKAWPSPSFRRPCQQNGGLAGEMGQGNKDTGGPQHCDQQATSNFLDALSGSFQGHTVMSYCKVTKGTCTVALCLSVNPRRQDFVG